MLVVDVITWKGKESPEKIIICSLGWSDEESKIVILKGKRVGKEILTDRFLDKRYYPKKLKYIEAKQGRDFIKNLCYGLAGSRVWSTIPREEDAF